MSNILNEKNIKTPYEFKVTESINITGKMVDRNNNAICNGIVVAFHKNGNRLTPICYDYTNKQGKYKLNICDRLYNQKDIVIRYYADGCKELNRKVECDICLKDAEDFIIYGKIKDSHLRPIKGAIVAAFLEEDDVETEICHVFTGRDGSYMLNIPYYLRGKSIKIRAVKTSRDVYCT